MRFKNQITKDIVDVKHPEIWTLLFGSFYFAKYKIWDHTMISALLVLVTGGISMFIYPIFAAKIIKNAYIKRGWIEVGDDEGRSSDYDTVAKLDKLIKQKNKNKISDAEYNEQRNKLFDP
jgi:hypothetical protein